LLPDNYGKHAAFIGAHDTSYEILNIDKQGDLTKQAIDV